MSLDVSRGTAGSECKDKDRCMEVEHFGEKVDMEEGCFGSRHGLAYV